MKLSFSIKCGKTELTCMLISGSGFCPWSVSSGIDSRVENDSGKLRASCGVV